MTMMIPCQCRGFYTVALGSITLLEKHHVPTGVGIATNGSAREAFFRHRIFDGMSFVEDDVIPMPTLTLKVSSGTANQIVR